MACLICMDSLVRNTTNDTTNDADGSCSDSKNKELEHLVVLSSCGHAFHKICLIEWFRNAYYPVCPSCRQRVNAELMKPLYLNMTVNQACERCQETNARSDRLNQEKAELVTKYNDECLQRGLASSKLEELERKYGQLKDCYDALCEVKGKKNDNSASKSTLDNEGKSCTTPKKMGRWQVELTRLTPIKVTKGNVTPETGNQNDGNSRSVARIKVAHKAKKLDKPIDGTSSQSDARSGPLPSVCTWKRNRNGRLRPKCKRSLRMNL